jgi:hypothetical protein
LRAAATPALRAVVSADRPSSIRAEFMLLGTRRRGRSGV